MNNYYQGYQQPYQQMPQFNQSAAQRLAQLDPSFAQQYPQYAPVQQAQTAQAYDCRPVTSVDEVKAVQVDFTGRPTFFYDASHNAVYIKQLDMNTGAAAIRTFSLETDEPKQMVMEQVETVSNYVSSDEFDAFKQDIYEKIGGITNVQSYENVTDGADATEPVISASSANGTGKKSRAAKSDD